MARTIRDAQLDTRTARSRLKPRGKPYYRAIEEGLHLGYRKGKGRAGGPATAGKWVVRRYIGGQDYKVETLDGGADDFSDADGVAILSFQQAQQKARAMMVNRAHAAANVGPYTVADATDDYFKFLQSEGRSEAAIADARWRDLAFIRPKLGETELAALTSTALRDWRDALARSAPRLRTRAGAKQNHRESAGDDDSRRARRATTNRNWTLLRRVLNYAFEHGKINSDAAWRKVKPFKGADKARVRYLQVAEAKRLINATDPEFRPMVHAALLTGGRYGQLAALTVADFNSDAGTVTMRTRKGDGTQKTYHVHLTDEGRAFFRQMCAGRLGPAPIFSQSHGSPWKKSHQMRRMKTASERAKIGPPVTFHCTRHTYASHSIMNGAPLLVVAQNLGHADTRMVEKHYGHLAPSYVADAIRAAAPRFGIKTDQKVATLSR